jgi:DNA recombination protein RmuC
VRVTQRFTDGISLAIEKRSSEVWTVLSAVQSEFEKYNSVVLKLGKQLHTAATSVDNLGRRARAMNRTLKSVDKLPEGVDRQSILGLTTDDMENNVVDLPQPEIEMAEASTL